MSQVVQGHLLPDWRHKIYLSLIFISLFLLFFSIWQVKPVIVSHYSSVGLVSYFTPAYWAGLALILVTSIFAGFDGELKKDAVFIALLLSLDLFLIGVGAFIEENAREPSTYYPFSEVKNLLTAHHIDLNLPLSAASMAPYQSWPAYHFISAAILTITGLDINEAATGFLMYMPLFFIVCFVFTTYAIGKRLDLTPNRCFLVSFLALSSLIVEMNNYAPRSLAMGLYLLLFMLLLTPRRTAAEVIIAVLLFSVLVLTHGFTSLTVFPALILLSIYRKETRFIALFIVIFGAWYLYQASGAIEVGLRSIAKPMQMILFHLQTEQYQVAASTARLACRYSMLSYVALYVVLVSGSAILLLARRITGQRRKQVISLFCWAIGVSLLLLGGGGEVTLRLYLFNVVPASCIVVLSFSRRRMLIPLMCLFVGLNPFANYSLEAAWGQVLTTELKGTEFLALKVKPVERYFYAGPGQLTLYSDPNLVVQHSAWLPLHSLGPKKQEIRVLNSLKHVILGKMGNDSILAAWQEDPFAAWPQGESGGRADLIYNNGYFQIYENHLMR